MLRVILDTNIYGLLVMEEELKTIKEKITRDKELIIYGSKTIRKELRKTPKTSKLGNLSKRNLLLSVYDKLTKGRVLEEDEQISNIAQEIYEIYRKQGGIRNWDKTNIDKDFLIFACAAVHKLDIIITEDLKTLAGNTAMKAYESICQSNNLRMPKFWKYLELKKRYAL